MDEVAVHLRSYAIEHSSSKCRDPQEVLKVGNATKPAITLTGEQHDEEQSGQAIARSPL